MLSESRLTAWQSSDGLPFAYSGKVMEPAPFSPNVLRLRDALYERTGVLYDGVLLNLYESRYTRACLVWFTTQNVRRSVALRTRREVPATL